MIITRFAPSPTGYLHIGGLRTALFNFLYARANKGKFLLRIEDTDFSRNSKEATEAIIKAFSWVGLDYDSDIVYQSQRLDIYKEYAKKLLENNKAYYCYMSKEELDSLRENYKKEGKIYKYDNRYRDFSGTPPKDIKPVIRIKAPLSGKVSFNDSLKGRIEIDAKELDDYIIMRSDGTPTYNFVVAIDDALMNISDVIRGDDHLSNTPKQIIVYEALGFNVPRFCHIPMILNDKGYKLSKRDGAMNVMDYKGLGILPEALLNFLIRLGFSYGDKEIFSLKDGIELFNLDNLSSSPSSYNQSKLLWLNNYYIKNLSIDKLDLALQKQLSIDLAKKEILYKEIKERVNTIVEFREMIDSIIQPPKSYDDKMIKKLDLNLKPKLLEILNLIDFNNVEVSLKDIADKNGFSVGKLLSAFRLALLGKSGGIGINETLFILGKDECKKRIEAFLSKNRG
ncbi:glutamate--tRNA ligase [Helicobacter sp. MIT 14-3879]|uniref:glutamate--tRNA ligase n=1 Tax=Helicobacter sp. MIT 14-3879 TaxID=2040649 RepID=UPI0015F12EDA|nr:glutamate--tRNA ligase [Helicobacter sp. MIT 14-3879]